MKITRDNYQTYFLDYWEIGLDKETQQELVVFLQNNPDLLDEFNDCKDLLNCKVQPDLNVKFPRKNILKKLDVNPVGSINVMNWEEVTIAWLEGDLNEEQKAEFEEFLKANPHLEKEIKLFQLTRLVPENIPFENKKAFIQPVGSEIRITNKWLKTALAFAASVLLFLAVYHFLPINIFHKKQDISHTIQKPVNESQDHTTPSDSDMVVADRENTAISPVLTPNSISHKSSGTVRGNGKNEEFTSHFTSGLTNLDPIQPISLQKIDFVLYDNHNLQTREKISLAFSDLLIQDELGNRKSFISRIVSHVGFLSNSPILKDQKTTTEQIFYQPLFALAGKEIPLETENWRPILKINKSGEATETVFAWGNTLTFKRYKIKAPSSHD